MPIEILTFRDCIDHLVDYGFGVSQDRELNILKRSVRQAYRDVMEANNWTYNLGLYTIWTNPAYSTGTVEFDLTGGANERQLTLTGGTWPTYAAGCSIGIGGEVYYVDQRISNSVVTLEADNCPNEDLAANTPYILRQDSYELPDNFRRIYNPGKRQTIFLDGYVTPEVFITLQQGYRYGGDPMRWTIMRTEEGRDGGMSICVAGYPTSSQRIFFLYEKEGSNLNLAGTEAKCSVGTVTLVADSKAVVGVSTTFDQSMVGCYLRTSSDATTVPTDNNGDNPYIEQHKIRSVTDATNLVLWTAAEANASGKKYVVSSYLDMEESTFNALLRRIEWYLAVEQKDVDGRMWSDSKEKQYWQALELAKEMDNKRLSQLSAMYPGYDDFACTYEVSFSGTYVPISP